MNQDGFPGTGLPRQNGKAGAKIKVCGFDDRKVLYMKTFQQGVSPQACFMI